MIKKILLGILFCAFLTPLSATTPSADSLYDAENGATTTPTVKDPYEPYNRVMFAINEKLDEYLMKPIAIFYNKATPRPLNRAIDRALTNAEGIPAILNDTLQANFYQAISDTWRLTINSTVGIGGAFDVATPMGLSQNSQDFGLTLARWGWKNSNYFVLPALGPKTLRDTVAVPVDYLSSAYSYFLNTGARNSLMALSLINRRARLLRFEDVYQQMALDRYVFIRNAYLQRRNYLIARTAQLNNPYTSEETEQLRTEENNFLNE